MIDIKSAVRIAIQHLQELQEFIPANELRLEETEYDDTGYWLITLSTLSASDSSFMPSLTHLTPVERIYKQFRIDSETGQVKSMKVRTLQPAD